MYESFYGFREKPFSILPDADFLYLSPRHDMALALLQYGLMNQAGLSVITGEIGAGKTTLIRYLLGRLPGHVTAGLVSNTHRSFAELLEWLLIAFSLEGRGRSYVEKIHAIEAFLARQHREGQRTVVIIDEAQNMARDTLEGLRMLLNVNADKRQILQVILVGQPGLRAMLRRPDMEQFAQRVAVDYHLLPLTGEETGRYVRHRLAVAGGADPNLFDDGACAELHRHSRGVPRLINLLCDTALVYAFADQLRHIDAKLVRDVAADKMKGGIFPKGRDGPPEASTALPDTSRSAASDERPVVRVPVRATEVVASEDRVLAAAHPAMPEVVSGPSKTRRDELYDKLQAAVSALIGKR